MKQLRLTLALAALAFAPTLAKADPIAYTTFTFTGNCTDCTGTGVGTLVVENYTPGVEMGTANFVSFSYSSNLVTTYDPAATDGGFAFDATLSSTPGPYSVSITETSSSFVSAAGGSWSLSGFLNESNISNPNAPPPIQDYGSTSSWTTASAVTPEPASLVLLGTGLIVGAGMARRRLTAVLRTPGCGRS